MVKARTVSLRLMSGTVSSSEELLMKPVELLLSSVPTRCSGMATMAGKAWEDRTSGSRAPIWVYIAGCQGRRAILEEPEMSRFARWTPKAVADGTGLGQGAPLVLVGASVKLGAGLRRPAVPGQER